MDNLLKLSAVTTYMRQECPDGFCIESFVVNGNTAEAKIKIGKKLKTRTFTFNGNDLVGD